jgi:hypothetical protein
MAKANNRLDDVLNDTREFEDFFHALLPALAAKKLRHGDDVLPYARELKLKIPASIRGMDITWEADHSHPAHKRASETLVLVRPGHADAVGLTVGCVRVGKWKICLECGWIWCRIVVTRRF